MGESKKHYATQSKLPENAAVFPFDRQPFERQYPRPDAIPLGTYGKLKRTVYQKDDFSPIWSKTTWKQKGYKVMPNESPVDHRTWKHHCTYGMYGDWQVEPSVTNPSFTAPARDYGDADVFRALWTLNRQAKRYRDAASRNYLKGFHYHAKAASQKKRSIYESKSLLLAILTRLEKSKIVGITDGNPCFVVFEGGGYCFHCPQGNWPVTENKIKFAGLVEAKPKAAAEMRIRDAWATVEGFLSRNPPNDEDEELADAAELMPVSKPSRLWHNDDDCMELNDGDFEDDEFDDEVT